MTKKRKTIVEKHKENFETLREAFKNGDVCLVDCVEKKTKKHVAVICATQFDGKNYDVIPLARFFGGDPYKILEPLTPASG